MELKNLLNSDDPPISQKQQAVRIDPSENNFPLDAKSPSQIGSSKYNYSQPFANDYNNASRMKQSPPSTFNSVQQQSWSNTNMSSPGAFNQYPQTPQQYKGNYPTSHMELSPNQNQISNAPNGTTAKPIDFVQNSKQAKVGERSPNSNGTSAQTASEDRREVRHPKPLHGVAASLKTVERYRSGLIKNEVPVREPTSVVNDFPDHPILMNNEAYESTSNWNMLWKPENVEKIHPDIYVRDLKHAREVKRRIVDFRYHAEGAVVSGEDELWMARDIPLMHQLSCVSSKKNKNCMGCSNYWKCVSTIQEEIRPWGPYDLLHYEPGHSETFLGHISMNGSYLPLQREMLGCDVANTMYYSDDPNGVCLWGLVAPHDVFKLTEEDSLGVHFYEQKSFVDPTFLEKKVKVTYAIQRPGQTIVIPSGWVFFMLRVGRGLAFCASWSFLRLKHIIEARQMTEVNRSLGIFKPINISSLVISATYQKLEELETLENTSEKRHAIEFLFNILPILKVATLEELLGEPLSISSMVVLSYDLIVDKLKKQGRAGRLTNNTLTELSHLRLTSLATIEEDAAEDDEDAQFSCCICKYVLFNTRRSCPLCKQYDLCEQCYNNVGISHPHKMKKLRRMTLNSLMDLVNSVLTATYGQEELAIQIPANPLPPQTSPTVFPATVEREKEVIKELVSPSKQVVEVKEAPTLRESTRENKRRRREPKQELSPEPRDSHDSYDQEVIDCICGNNKDLGFMISCEKCYAWLHGKCVGISRRNEPEEYYCPRCVKKMGALNAAAKLNPKNFSPERKLREYKLA